MKSSRSMLRLFIVLAVAGVAVSCAKPWTMADYMATHKNGIQRLKPASQMNSHYAEVDNFIVHFGSTQQPLEWQTVAFIEGRFELTYVQPVQVDYSNHTVSAVGEPKFYLHAIKTVQVLPDGRTQTSYDGNLQREFGRIDWEKFIGSEYDLTKLGIPKEAIHSVPNWKEHVQGWRKDRVPIK